MKKIGKKDQMRYIRAGLPDDAAEFLEAFLTENGVTLGAWLEALCEMIAARGPVVEDWVPIPPDTFLQRARAITAERRKRPGR
jgi:hypothetical protein